MGTPFHPSRRTQDSGDLQMGVQNGAEWKNTRSHLDPHFSFTSANSVIATTKNAIKTWAETLPQEVNAGVSGPFELDAIIACRQLPFRLIAMALYGEVFSEELFGRLWDLNTLHEEVTFVTFLSPAAKNWWYPWLPTKANATLRKFNKLWKELNLDAVSLARKRGISIPLEGMYQAVENGNIDMTSFLQSLDEIIFTNIDITSTIFAYCLINLAGHPNEQNNLRSEILSKENDIATLDRYLKEENTQLHHVYLELLRNNPPAWFSLPEMTAKDKYIGGYLIPAATPVIIDVRRLNQDSPIWAPDGKVFRPRRWDSVSRLDARYSLHGYGLGPRKCLGKNFASIMIKLFVITVLENYQLGGALDTKLRRDTWTRVPESVVSFENLS
ncbi:hypothetical protein N7481_003614 [Penicillium waksmanii]|uniref:uncharacterized protein n=1 Tax=Penicillium waksmanii TaxID=69791 RepID=UPI0025469DE3|nr:uncharacterized protein N7481_003614 [Penicillium waksmanii]KAJ5988404.1 hypothetical protein N7481_003614 [Penicillium waksmanii]